jgi:hypothetical protein
MTTHPSDGACLWCGHPFRARRGGSPQRFCRAGAGPRSGPPCADGASVQSRSALTVIDLRNGATAACTLQREPVLRGSPPAVPEHPRGNSPLVAPAETQTKATGSLDDFLITPLDLPQLVRFRRHAPIRQRRVCSVASAARCGRAVTCRGLLIKPGGAK